MRAGVAEQFKNTFKASEKILMLHKKRDRALKLSLNDVVVDLQKRLDSGTGTDGRRYKYSKKTAEIKGKEAPVDWTNTGLLRRSIDFLVKIGQSDIIGLIGIKDVQRGNTSNKEIHRNLIKRFPTLWGLSKTEKQNFINNFLRYFRG